MRRFVIAIQVLIVVAALAVGASAGYVLKPTSSVVVLTAAPATSTIDACLFSRGHKVGC